MIPVQILTSGYLLHDQKVKGGREREDWFDILCYRKLAAIVKKDSMEQLGLGIGHWALDAQYIT